MRDEHLIYTDLPDGKIKITAQEGYLLYCALTRTYLSEAITIEKNIKYFVSETEKYREITGEEYEK